MKQATLTINQPVEVGIVLSNTRKMYPSRVMDIEGLRAILAAPLNNGDVIPLSVGTEIDIHFTSQSSSWTIPSRVLSREGGMNPVIIVDISVSPIRSQRREFVRVPCVIVGLMNWFDEKGNHEVRCLITDISGGGLAVTIKSDSEPKLGTTVKVVFSLSSESEPFNLKAKVVRLSSIEKNTWQIGVDLGNLPNNVRDTIIKYVVNRQRELIAKGVLRHSE